MVNPGHRSKGCDRCRAQKVKCDQAQPRCRRCSDRGHLCEYTLVQRSFQSMNTWAQSSVSCRVRQAEVKRAGKAPQLQFCEVPPPELSKQDLSVSDVLPEATRVFFEEFVYPPDHLHSTHGFLSKLPSLYERTSAKFVREAVHAVALVWKANTSRLEHFNEPAGEAYRNAICSLKGFFGSPKSTLANEALIAVVLLGVYELLSGSRPPELSWYHAHIRGMSLILLMDLKIDKTLAAATLRLLYSEDLAARRQPSVALKLNADYHASWLDEACSRAGLITAGLSAQTKELQERYCRGEDIQPNEWNQLTSGLCGALDIINDYFDSASDEWFAQTMFTADGERVDSYPSLSNCVLWNHIRVMRLHCWLLLIGIHDVVLALPQPPIHRFPDLRETEANISTTVEDIRASCRYQIGDSTGLPEGYLKLTGRAVGKVWLIWILQMLCDVPGLARRHKEWVLEFFGRAGDGGIFHGYFLQNMYSAKLSEEPWN